MIAQGIQRSPWMIIESFRVGGLQDNDNTTNEVFDWLSEEM